jgi:hypothetical protein
MLGIVQAAALPVALPDTAIVDEPVDQVTEIAPDPPEAEPVRVTEAAVVVAAVALTVKVSGATEGEAGGAVVVVGGATAPVCAAYKVWTAAISSAVRPETIL